MNKRCSMLLLIRVFNALFAFQHELFWTFIFAQPDTLLHIVVDYAVTSTVVYVEKQYESSENMKNIFLDCGSLIHFL